MVLVGEEFEAPLDQALLESLPAPPVPFLNLFKPLVKEHSETRVEGINHRDRRRVVVGPDATTGHVIGDHREVEIPGRRPFHEGVDGGGRDGNRREPGRHTETLLGAAIGKVNPPGVYLQGNPAK